MINRSTLIGFLVKLAVWQKIQSSSKLEENCGRRTFASATSSSVSRAVRGRSASASQGGSAGGAKVDPSGDREENHEDLSTPQAATIFLFSLFRALEPEYHLQKIKRNTFVDIMTTSWVWSAAKVGIRRRALQNLERCKNV